MYEITAMSDISTEYYEKLRVIHEEFNANCGFGRFVGYVEDEIYYHIEDMIGYLLHEEVLFANSRKYLCRDNKTERSETIVLFVVLNDVFEYACADCESITMEELPELCEMYCKHKYLGVVKWAMNKRKSNPIKLWIEDMKKANLWEEIKWDAPVV